MDARRGTAGRGTAGSPGVQAGDASTRAGARPSPTGSAGRGLTAGTPSALTHPGPATGSAAPDRSDPAPRTTARGLTPHLRPRRDAAPTGRVTPERRIARIHAGPGAGGGVAAGHGPGVGAQGAGAQAAVGTGGAGVTAAGGDVRWDGSVA